MESDSKRSQSLLIPVGKYLLQKISNIFLYRKPKSENDQSEVKRLWTTTEQCGLITFTDHFINLSTFISSADRPYLFWIVRFSSTHCSNINVRPACHLWWTVQNPKQTAMQFLRCMFYTQTHDAVVFHKQDVLKGLRHDMKETWK